MLPISDSSPCRSVRSGFSAATHILILITASFLFHALPGHAQPDTLSRTARVEDLRDHVFPIQTVDPKSDEFSDLQFLKKIIGDRRIVILGEPTHGDGTAFKAKGRLVRFLHQEMDFSVLAFESGLYDLHQATSHSESPHERLQAAVSQLARPWAHSSQARPVIEYYAETHDNPRPLHLAGIDIVPRQDSLFMTQLQNHLQKRGLWSDLSKKFTTTLKKQLENPLFRPSDTSAYLQFTGILTQLKKELRDGSSNDAYWAQMLSNVDAMAQTAWQRSYTSRNRQMADNLDWLATQTYPEEKIIVWVASSHGIRNLKSLTPIDSEQSYEGRQSMGDFLTKFFDGGVYTLVFTAYEGTYGAYYWRDPKPKAIDTPRKGSLEDLLGALPYDYSLLDLTGVPDNHWLSRPLVARPLGYSPMRASWDEVVDGIMFIQTMQPNTKL